MHLYFSTSLLLSFPHPSSLSLPPSCLSFPPTSLFSSSSLFPFLPFFSHLPASFFLPRCPYLSQSFYLPLSFLSLPLIPHYFSLTSSFFPLSLSLPPSLPLSTFLTPLYFFLSISPLSLLSLCLSPSLCGYWTFCYSPNRIDFRQRWSHSHECCFFSRSKNWASCRVIYPHSLFFESSLTVFNIPRSSQISFRPRFSFFLSISRD